MRLVVDIVSSASRNPVRVSEGFESRELVLAVPELCAGVGVLRRRELALGFGDADLVFEDVHLLPPLALVFEPSVGDTLRQADLTRSKSTRGWIGGSPQRKISQ